MFDPFQYTYIKHLRELNKYTSYFAFALGAGQLAFVVNFFHSLFAGKKAEKNPWDVGTLEWTDCESPPVYHNFDRVPIVLRGPHEYNNPEVLAKLGKDWVGQSEQLPGEDIGIDAIAAE